MNYPSSKMNKLFFAFLALAFVHVARGLGKPPPAVPDEPAQASAPAAPEKTHCDANGQHYNHGDRFCKSDKVSSVCAYGEVYDFDCPGNSKCWKYPNEPKVQCLEVNRNAPWPKGPGDEHQADQADHHDDHHDAHERRRRDDHHEHDDKQDQHDHVAPATPEKTTCEANGQTYQHGDRFCKSETVTGVCAFGQTYDFDCPSPSKCWKYPNEPKVQCLQVNRNAPWPKGPTGTENSEPQSNSQQQSSQTHDHHEPDQPQPAQPQPQPQPAPQPQPSQSQPESPQSQPAQPSAQEHKDQCDGGPRGTLKDGESFCSGEHTYKHCHHDQLVEETCEQGASCKESPTVPNAVLCRLIIRNAPQKEGPKESHRRR